MVDMSTLDKLRAEAAALEAAACASGNPIKHSDALEEVAKRHGYKEWRACVAAFSDAALSNSTPNPFEMKRYRSSEWSFSLDIPARWNTFPVVPTNSPWEVVRFASHENGFHTLIVFREPYDPKQSPEEHSKLIQDILEKQGFSNFVNGKAKIGSKTMLTLDFDKASEASVWSCRHYFMIDGSTLAYVLGFGSTKWADMDALFGRMAQSFAIE
jgi:Glyoxalase superfamily protein